MLRGEWVPAAQGEAIVSGRTTPAAVKVLEQTQPAIYRRLHEVADQLERAAREPQDIEFTVERGTLFLLQSPALKSGSTRSVQDSWT